MVFLLFLSSEHIIKRENNFTRRFIPSAILEDESFDLKYYSYYFAGYHSGEIFLGNVTAPLLLTRVDTALQKTTSQTIRLDNSNHKFMKIFMTFRCPFLYVSDGSVPVIYLSKLNDTIASTLSVNDVYFSHLQPIDSVRFAFRAQSSKTKQNVLGTLKVKTKDDGIFDTDGQLLLDSFDNSVVYIHYYTNKILVMDSALNILHELTTIDTISKPQIEVSSSSGGKHQMAAPPLTINKNSTVFKNLLFNRFIVLSFRLFTSFFDKFDILSKRGIGHIDDSVKLIKKNQGIDVDIRNTKISKDEAFCNEYLGKGKTIGCFYIESPAMRRLLRRLKHDNYKVLVAASSIISPGVAQSGMMKEYIFRHNYPDKFEYFHDVFREQLGETYGIMVYKEDVIKIALHYAGVPASDGDILRRAMSGKGRSKAALQRVKDNFFACCAQKGHPLKLSREIYRQIESFAGYSFCKAHSASYAVESYQSLYLKVHYPLEFMTAVINNFGGFNHTELYVHEARMSGGNIQNPCVKKSDFSTTIEGKNIYLGFHHLKSLEFKVAEAIVGERLANGQFISL